MPDFKNLQITTEATAKTCEIVAPAFSDVDVTKMLEDLMKKVPRSPEPRPGQPYCADYLYPSICLPSPYTPWWYRTPTTPQLPTIKKVVFNAPATIVFWGDDTKTVVTCQPDDTFSRETGLAMAITKKVYGNKGNYNNVFRKWVPKDE